MNEIHQPYRILDIFPIDFGFDHNRRVLIVPIPHEIHGNRIFPRHQDIPEYQLPIGKIKRRNLSIRTDPNDVSDDLYVQVPFRTKMFVRSRFVLDSPQGIDSDSFDPLAHDIPQDVVPELFGGLLGADGFFELAETEHAEAFEIPIDSGQDLPRIGHLHAAVEGDDVQLHELGQVRPVLHERSHVLFYAEPRSSIRHIDDAPVLGAVLEIHAFDIGRKAARSDPVGLY